MSGSSINVDYTIPKPSLGSGYQYLLISLLLSNQDANDTFTINLDNCYDINYVGVLKKNDLYCITNNACVYKQARAIFAVWED